MTAELWRRSVDWASRVWAQLPAVATAAAGFLTVHWPAMTMLAVGGAAVVAAVRIVATRRALADRLTYELRPADTFNPSPEQIGRWAAMLAKTRRSVRGWAERPGTAVRIQLTSRAGGRFAFTVSGPRRARDLLVMSGWPDVEVRVPEQGSFEADREPVGIAAQGDGCDTDATGEPNEATGNVIELVAHRRRRGNRP